MNDLRAGRESVEGQTDKNFVCKCKPLSGDETPQARIWFFQNGKNQIPDVFRGERAAIRGDGDGRMSVSDDSGKTLLLTQVGLDYRF